MRASAASEAKDEIDEQLYSRQLFVVGRSAQLKMSAAAVLVENADGVAAEVAKNLALSGVRKIVLADSAVVAAADLSANCFLRAGDVGAATRSAATAREVAELNPHCEVVAVDGPQEVAGFAAVVLCGGSTARALELDAECRAAGAGFVWATVRGVFSRVFVDGGAAHSIEDANGEPPQSFYVGGISQAEEGVVEVLQQAGEAARHDLQDGDRVRFSEVGGMTELNSEALHTIKRLDKRSFSIGDTRGFSAFTQGGLCTEVKVPHTVAYRPLAECLEAPEFDMGCIDYNSFGSPPALHAGMRALEQLGREPRPWHEGDADEVLRLAGGDGDGDGEFDEAQQTVIRLLSKTAAGCFPPLAAAVGGWAAQEALKLVTNKFTPQPSWVYLDLSLVAPDSCDDFEAAGDDDDRYAALRICIGTPALERLQAARAFIVGAGAIGCEHLKNLALLGVGCAEAGRVTVTDPDGIEKSNLSRQFLFRASDISKSKSLVAAQAAAAINPAFRATAQMAKICPEKENLFSDGFFAGVDAILTAVDNIKARLYVDRRAVETRTPLFESGTLGTKGHVQTIVPFDTESYGAVRDPPDTSTPMCTVKHFPSTMEHTIQWARDKFHAVLTLKLEQAARFIEDEGFLERMSTSERARRKLLKQLKSALITNRPSSWPDCLRVARVRFEKYFSHRLQKLLAVYPADHVLEGGKPFWAPPRRLPAVAAFSADEPLHMDFVMSFAALLARAYGIEEPTEPDDALVLATLADTPLPELRIDASKHIETDPAAGAGDGPPEPPPEEEEDAEAEAALAAEFAAMEAEVRAARAQEGLSVQPIHFEKDDDSHIYFVMAASGLRSANYRLPEPSFMEAKKVAGSIVPAIATTTSVVSALSVAELVKVVGQGRGGAACRSSFLNLALPMLQLVEPQPPRATRLGNSGVEITEWTRWEAHGRDLRLGEFLHRIQGEHGLTVASLSLARGQEIIYHPVIAPVPERTKMRKLLGMKARAKYADLAVALKEEGSAELLEGPVVRYYAVDED